MIAFEVKRKDPKYTWKTIGIYRVPYEHMGVIEILSARSGYSKTSTKRRTIGINLNLPQADLNDHADRTNEIRAFLNRFVWNNGYAQVVNSWMFTLSGLKIHL